MSIAKDIGGSYKNHEQLFLYAGRTSKIETCKRAVPSESNGERRGYPMMLVKLTKLLKAAARLITQLAILAALLYALSGR